MRISELDDIEKRVLMGAAVDRARADLNDGRPLTEMRETQMESDDEQNIVGDAAVDRKTATVAEPQDSITLKWGTLKAWTIKTPTAKALLEKWASLGYSYSARRKRC